LGSPQQTLSRALEYLNVCYAVSVMSRIVRDVLDPNLPPSAVFQATLLYQLERIRSITTMLPTASALNMRSSSRANKTTKPRDSKRPAQELCFRHVWPAPKSRPRMKLCYLTRNVTHPAAQQDDRTGPRTASPPPLRFGLQTCSCRARNRDRVFGLALLKRYCTF
jgi:hypothetical protein